MHSTEDPYSGSHGWSEALRDPRTAGFDPALWWEYFQHGLRDMFPTTEEVNGAIAADRQLIQQWMQMNGRKSCP